MKTHLMINQQEYLSDIPEGVVGSPTGKAPRVKPSIHHLPKTLALKKSPGQPSLILPFEKQIKAWRRANSRMGWGIKEKEYDGVQRPLEVEESEQKQGYIGTMLFYGFGDDGSGNSDPVLSGKKAWDFARKKWWKETWQCEYIDFDKPEDIRLRPDAPARPKGFYFAKFRPGDRFISITVSQFRKRLVEETGCGPEGLQFLTITHKHFQKLMNDRKIPFMALADYDVAPYGHNDFFDAVQMFCSNHVLGLGIGNVDQNYPNFGIPSLRFF